ncbi:MAG: hypothetical protein IH628_03460 [Proteobacteria bacterium]|nr:hypothetical protein [Pseudomonadota bacterium]
MQTIITVIYYLLIAATSGLLVANFLKTKDWQRELLYVIVLIPFLLRLLMLK